MTKQPRALYVLSFAYMWKSFSQFGNRALLVLYMIQSLEFSDQYALGIYAVFCGLAQLGGVLGGIVADRLLGLRRAIMLGGWLICAGHICMASNRAFLPGLALIVVGTSLYTTNITALLSLYFDEEDERRDKAFSLFYRGINLGALLATLLCSFLATWYGWHYGFGLAAIGMVIANLTLLFLDDKGKTPRRASQLKVIPWIGLSLVGVTIAMTQEWLILPLLPWVSIACLGWIFYQLKQPIPYRIFIAAIFLFAAEEQIGSSLLVFAERGATDTLFGIPIPTASILSINSFIIIALGAFVPSTSLSRPLLITAFAFGCVSLGACYMDKLPLIIVVCVYVLISLSEFMIGPVLFSTCSKMASKEKTPGLVMTIVPLCFSLSSLIGGQYSKLMVQTNASFAFGTIALVLVVIALITLEKKHKTLKNCKL